MDHMPEPGHVAAPPSFTAKQGQYLAFIHAYTWCWVVPRLKPICNGTSA
jgi:hypothetical protein